MASLIKFTDTNTFIGFPGGSVVKNTAVNAGDAGDMGLIYGLGRSLGEGNGNSLLYLAWRIPWTEEPDRLRSIGSQRIRHNRETNTLTFRSKNGKFIRKIV